MNSNLEFDIKHEEDPWMMTEIKSEPQVSYKFLYFPFSIRQSLVDLIFIMTSTLHSETSVSLLCM